MELDFSLPPGLPRATFAKVYSALALHQAALKLYTKALFHGRKAAGTSHDGLTLYDFARHGQQHLAQVHRALVQERFVFREALELRYQVNSKRRAVYLYPWEERLVDLLLFLVLNRRFHGVFAPDSYAYRQRGYGVDQCQHRLARLLGHSPPPLFFLKRDVQDYFPSIDHELLLAGLRAWIEPDDYLFELLRQRVVFRFRRPPAEAVEQATRGVAFGTATACFFANLYLTPLDRAIRRLPQVRYFRYADDLLLVSRDADTAAAARTLLSEGLAALRLASKPRQHLDAAFLPAGAAPVADFQTLTRFKHLGLEFRADGSLGLSRDKFRKLCNLFRFAFRRYARRFAALTAVADRVALAIQVSRRLIEHGLRPVAIIDYYLKHVTDEAQLARLDRWLAEEVLSLALRTGHRKGNFRRLSFAELRRRGLPSLRHRRRLLQHGHLQSSFFVLRKERLLTTRRPAGPRPAAPATATPGDPVRDDLREH